jgi:hypothetical protein
LGIGLRTSKFGHFIVLKGTNILLSLKLKLVMKIKAKYPTFKIKMEELIPKSPKNEVLGLLACLKVVLDSVTRSWMYPFYLAFCS